MKSAEQLRQAMEIHEATGIEQTGQHVQHRILEPIFGESARDQRIIVRPDGAIVIRHGVVTGLRRRERSDAPS